jgi:hypothetical protein
MEWCAAKAVRQSIASTKALAEETVSAKMRGEGSTRALRAPSSSWECDLKRSRWLLVRLLRGFYFGFAREAQSVAGG